MSPSLALLFLETQRIARRVLATARHTSAPVIVEVPSRAKRAA